MASIKGFLFTIGFLLFSVSLLSFIVIIFATNYQEDKRVSEIGALDRINTLDSSAQNSLKKIFEAFSNINVSLYASNSNYVIFNETLPNDVKTFRTSLNDFKIFVEQNFPYISINTSELNDTIPLIVMPDKIVYHHVPIDNDATNQIIVTPEELTPNSRLRGYNVIVTHLPDIFCIPTTFPQGNNYFSLTITASTIGIPGTPSTCSIPNQLIDPNLANIVQIGGVIDPDSYLRIEVSNGGVLKIKNTQNSGVVATILRLDNIEGNQTKVMLPDSIIRVSDPTLNIYKKGTARIL